MIETGKFIFSDFAIICAGGAPLVDLNRIFKKKYKILINRSIFKWL